VGYFTNPKLNLYGVCLHLKIRQEGVTYMSQVTIKREEIALRICQNCKGLDGHHFISTKRRCLICERLTQPLDKDFIFRKDEQKKMAGKWPKNIKRFPRKLEADPEQQRVIALIEEKVKDFDCPGKVTDVHTGPVVTEYEFAPDRYTRLKRLKSLNEDLAVALSADAVTVQRLPGKAVMGISIANKDRKKILFNDCLQNALAHRNDMAVPINFGITSTGEPCVVDLAEMPHMLVAGETGSGKSVFLNNVLLSLLYMRSPKELQLVLVDPKSVELFPYKGLPHLMGEPINDVWRALGAMDMLIEEMKRRMTFLHITGVKNLKEFNAKMVKEGKPDDVKPYIVMVIDEMADLILQERKEFTVRMASLAAMARAAGIHVIACTQRPSVDILKGTVKVNFPTRVAFHVPAAADSKTVLNYKGAEQLLGKGDMFAILPGKGGLTRLHSPLVEKADVEKMLKLSIELGHVLTVPADGLKQKANGTTGKPVVVK
jgi:DNA segregation ATPase FtsK/SpoIIIE, S-DNA-T family